LLQPHANHARFWMHVGQRFCRLVQQIFLLNFNVIRVNSRLPSPRPSSLPPCTLIRPILIALGLLTRATPIVCYAFNWIEVRFIKPTRIFFSCTVDSTECAQKFGPILYANHCASEIAFRFAFHLLSSPETRSCRRQS
jgi:hypothetical protein